MGHLTAARAIAGVAHSGQKRKDGEDYIAHPLRVSGKLLAAGCSEHLVVAGVLHDVLEDSDWTPDQLLGAGLPPNVVHLVEAVTKDEDDAYADFIDRVSTDPRASVLKLADISDNYPSAPGRLKGRYQKAADVLRWTLADAGRTWPDFAGLPVLGQRGSWEPGWTPDPYEDGITEAVRVANRNRDHSLVKRPL